MLKNKNFLIGFAVGYFLLVLVPQANIMNLIKKG